MRGISVSILRSDLGDCTNNGVTSPARSEGRWIIVFDGLEVRDGNFELEKCMADDRYICLKVVRRHNILHDVQDMHLEPIKAPGKGLLGPMAGGNYVTSSDSRFCALSNYPLPVHDRFETTEEYNLLST